MPDKEVKLIVEGRVQGVFYRASTRDAALEIGVTGWVKNMPDGTVHALIQGDEAVVQQMMAWCRQGPPGSRVTQVILVSTTPREITQNYDTFEVRY